MNRMFARPLAWVLAERVAGCDSTVTDTLLAPPL